MACNGMYVPVNSKEQKTGNIIYGGSCRALLLKKLRLLDSTALGLGPHDSERDDPPNPSTRAAHGKPIWDSMLVEDDWIDVLCDTPAACSNTGCSDLLSS